MSFRDFLERLLPQGQLARRAEPEPPWIVVGLGNPGDEYRNTRHNVGHWCIRQLAGSRSTGAAFQGKQLVRLADTSLGSQRTVLAISRTYVNLSGEAVNYLLTRFRCGPEKLIVALDDINLPPGAIRIRRRGGHGGHNGLKSINSALGSEEFKRVRIGVGKPGTPEEQVDHVLGTFDDEERALVDEAVSRAAEAIAAIIAHGVDKAMNRFNSAPENQGRPRPMA